MMTVLMFERDVLSIHRFDNEADAEEFIYDMKDGLDFSEVCRGKTIDGDCEVVLVSPRCEVILAQRE